MFTIPAATTRAPRIETIIPPALDAVVGHAIAEIDGEIWFTSQAGLSILHGTRSAPFSRNEDLLEPRLESLIQDGTGRIWLGSRSARLQSYDPAKDLLESEASYPDSVWSIAEDSRGGIWFASNSGVHQYDGGSGVWTTHTQRDGLPNAHVLDILCDSDRRVWVATDAGVSVLPDGASRWTTYTVEDGLGDNWAKRVHEDREGQTWVGTWGGGVSVTGGFDSYTVAQGLPSNQIWSLLKDASGKVWVGTEAGLVSIDARGHLVRYTMVPLEKPGMSVKLEDGEDKLVDTRKASSFSSERIELSDGTKGYEAHSIHQNEKGEIWVGTVGAGVVILEDEHAIRTLPQEHIRSNRIFAIHGTESEGVLLGTPNGVLRFGAGERLQEQALSSITSLVHAISTDAAGTLWIGTWGDGLFGLVDGVLTRADWLPANAKVSSLSHDRAGRMWVTTDSGAYGRSRGQTERVAMPAGLLANWAWAVEEDRSGTLWIGTGSGGAGRFDGESMQTVTREDGLASNTVRAIVEDGIGTVWFGTPLGLTRYRQSRKAGPRVRISAVVADRRHVTPSEVEVPSTSTILAIEFDAVSLRTRPGGLLFRYRLKNLHDDWRLTHEERVEYSNLSAGRYRFELQAIDRDLMYSELAHTDIRVQFPVAQASIYGLTILLVLSLSTAAYQTRKRHQTERRRDPIRAGKSRASTGKTDAPVESLTGGLRCRRGVRTGLTGRWRFFPVLRGR